MKDTKVSTETDKKIDGLTDGDRGAMKARAKELKAAARAARNAHRPERL
jgi:hypothetical protein